MAQIKSVFTKGWSLISDGSQEENALCFKWLGLNVFAVSAFLVVKLSGV